MTMSLHANPVEHYLRLRPPGSTVWQPIETAPRDGSMILACNTRAGNDMTVVGWEGTCWTDVGCKNAAAAISINPNYFDFWMPLPLPPKSK